MFLHVGNNKNIRIKDIIGIFDTDNATVSVISRRFLGDAERRGLLESASFEIPKSFILYREGESFKVCLSQLSSTSLMGRIQNELV